MTLFFLHEGPMIQWEDGTLIIQDLNPEVKLQWAVSADELIAFGKKCIEAGTTYDAEP